MKMLLALCCLLSCPAFAEDTTALMPARWLPVGTYGGNQAMFVVEARDAKLELPCAHGTISHRPVLNEAGFFRVEGTYASNMHTNPPPPEFPATFTGHLVGNNLSLEVVVRGRGHQQKLSYSLVFGKLSRFFRCL